MNAIPGAHRPVPRQEQRVLILTALSEPTNKLIAHLHTYSFYDGTLVGSMMQFLSMQPFLADGWQKAADHVVQTARRMRAELIVLDGFRGIGSVVVRGVTAARQTRASFSTISGRS